MIGQPHNGSGAIAIPISHGRSPDIFVGRETYPLKSSVETAHCDNGYYANTASYDSSQIAVCGAGLSAPRGRAGCGILALPRPTGQIRAPASSVILRQCCCVGGSACPEYCSGALPRPAKSSARSCMALHVCAEEILASPGRPSIQLKRQRNWPQKPECQSGRRRMRYQASANLRRAPLPSLSTKSLSEIEREFASRAPTSTAGLAFLGRPATAKALAQASPESGDAGAVQDRVACPPPPPFSSPSRTSRCDIRGKGPAACARRRSIFVVSVRGG